MLLEAHLFGLFSHQVGVDTERTHFKTNCISNRHKMPLIAKIHISAIYVAIFAFYNHFFFYTGPRSAVGNVSGYRCVSDCRSRGREFDPDPVPYFRGDWSWNNFYCHSPPFHWFIQEGLLSVTSESMCTNYWLTACSSLPRKKCD